MYILKGEKYKNWMREFKVKKVIYYDDRKGWEI